MPPHYRGFTITFGYTTLGKHPLDEWSVRRRHYLTTHNTLKRQTFIPRRNSNPQSEQASGRRPTPCRLDASVPEERSKPASETSIFFNFRRWTKSKKGYCVIVHAHQYGSYFKNKQVTINVIHKNKFFWIKSRYALYCRLIYSEINTLHWI